MGVPKFFRYISERYPCLSELVRENQVPEFDNLYLDMNGIIHNCSHPNDNDVHFRITEEQIFKDIFYYLETLFNMIKPQKLFFLAVDGVAPRAKMNQQRGRRFRSAKDAEIQEKKAKEKGETLPTEARFDSNCITPGTPFMCRLDDALRYFIQYKISTSKTWRNCKVILSGHQTPGEGEHKIMEYIRHLKSQKKYDPNTRHCLYGLDADLVMLGLCTHERHFSLLREEVKFGKKNNKTLPVDQQRFFLLHLSLMRDYLELEFSELKNSLKFGFDIEKIIDDWVLMGFLVGNDFIPHIPNLHIHTDALPTLYETYKRTLPTLDGYINEGGYLNLSRLQKYIENLGQFDRNTFSSQYEDLKFLESKHQSGFNKRNDDTFGGNQDLMDMVRATEFEFDSSDENGDDVFEDDDEHQNGNDGLSDDEIFEKEFYQHRRNYYVEKLKYEEMTPEVLAEQAECYVTALQWTLSYYYHGVQSWGYFYPHHYAPFISDVSNFKDFKIKFDLGKPFLPFQQLMSVLPAGSKDHVPECYKELMTSPDSDLIDFYPTEFDTDLNGKKQEWEAVVLIPFIDENRLLQTLKRFDNQLTPEEKKRNVHGPMYIYSYSTNVQGSLHGPANFPSVGNLTCKEEKVYREEIQVPKDKLVLGPSKGSMKQVYFIGFPTLKHLKYTSELRLQHVKVFDQPSRKENMIIVVEPRTDIDKPIEILVKELMGRNVCVGWPHLTEAKIVRITDETKTFFNDGNSDKTDAHKWKVDIQAIKDHHSNRMGIDTGPIKVIVHVLQATGEELKFDPKLKIFKAMRTWDKIEAAYPIQCVVTDITAYRKNFKENLPLCDAFKLSTEIFMMTNPFYGYMGQIVDLTCFEKTARVKVCLTIPEEPNFDRFWSMHQKSKDSYMNSYQAAARLSISDNVFNRITGSVLVIAGMKRQVAEGQSKMNIGLQMKFGKQNEELAGYTKKERLWLYSEKVLDTVQEYYCKFPRVFEVMESRTSRNNNDVYFESDFFETTEGEDNLQKLMKWLSQLPHNKADRRSFGSESIEKETMDEILEEVIKAKTKPIRRITMQVKPQLLYAPSLNTMTSKAPDYNANYKLFDRVIVARESEKYSVGMKGTVIGVNRVKDLNPVRQDCLNKEDIYIEVMFDELNGNNKTGRIIAQNFVNISYGQGREKVVDGHEDVEDKKETKNVEPMENYSAVLRKPGGGPQNNPGFTEIWNKLKLGQQVTAPAGPTPKNVILAEKLEQQQKSSKEATKMQEADAQKKLNDAINRRMAEMNVNGPISPAQSANFIKNPVPGVHNLKIGTSNLNNLKMAVPNDQSVPIMKLAPTKPPTPPLEWLNSYRDNSSDSIEVMNKPVANNRRETVQTNNRPEMVQGTHQDRSIANDKPIVNENPRPKLEMPPRPSVPYFQSPRQHFPPQMGFPHPVPMYQQRVRMIPQMPMMVVPQQLIQGRPVQQLHPMKQQLIPAQQPFFKNNEAPIEPFFANNQPQARQQQQQKWYFNNSNNKQPQQQGKYRNNQQHPMSAPVTSTSSQQHNPFVPLQAARKSTKGKDMPSATSGPQSMEVAGPCQQNVNKVAPKAEEIAKKTEQTAKIVKNEENLQEMKKEVSSKPVTVDPRKSRLAIKF